MKNNLLKLNLLIMVFIINTSMKQSVSGIQTKVILKSGELKEFKTHKSINLKVTYDNLKIGDYNSEKEYIDIKVSENNKKEAGKGDQWNEKWKNAKSNVWPQRFEQLYNKILDKKLGIKCERNSLSNPYTLKVNVTFIEPGYNVGVSRKPAAANFEFELVNTQQPEEILVSLYVNHVPGEDAMGLDFDSDRRIGECFAKAGKMLANYIAKSKL